MNRELQAQKDALSGFQENIQPGRISGVLLYFTGSNATGETGGFGDLGSPTIKRNGRTLVNVDCSVFADMGDIRSGSNLLDSSQGGAFKATVFIPFYAISLEQALQITGASELNFEWSPASNSGTVFDSLNVSVYSQKSYRQEFYEYYILGDDQSESGSVSNRPYQLNRKNITEIYLTDSSDVVSDIALRQDGEQVYSIQPWDVLLAGTLYDNRLEVTNFDMVQLECYTKGQPLSIVNSDTVIQVSTTGAGTVGITTCHIEPNENMFG